MRFDSCMHLGTHPCSQGTEEWLCFRELHKDLGGLLRHRSLPLDPPSVSDSVCLGQGLKTLHPWQSPGAIGPGPALWKSLIESVTIHPERSFLLVPQGIVACFLSSWLVSLFLGWHANGGTQNALFYVWLFFIRVMIWENHLCCCMLFIPICCWVVSCRLNTAQLVYWFCSNTFVLVPVLGYHG